MLTSSPSPSPTLHPHAYPSPASAFRPSYIPSKGSSRAVAAATATATSTATAAAASSPTSLSTASGSSSSKAQHQRQPHRPPPQSPRQAARSPVSQSYQASRSTSSRSPHAATASPSPRPSSATTSASAQLPRKRREASMSPLLHPPPPAQESTSYSPPAPKLRPGQTLSHHSSSSFSSSPVIVPGATTSSSSSSSSSLSAAQRAGQTSTKSVHGSSPKRARQGSSLASPAVKLLPARYELCNVKDLVQLISSMLMELVQHNDEIPLKDGSLTRFHSRAPPRISIHDYLARLTQHATLSPPLLLSMVYYIDRLATLYPAFVISSLTVHRFLITAATVASKGLSDCFWLNSTYARVGGISLRELALLELEFLGRVQWRIVPRPEVLRDYYSSLVERDKGFQIEAGDSLSSPSLPPSSSTTTTTTTATTTTTTTTTATTVGSALATSDNLNENEESRPVGDDDRIGNAVHDAAPARQRIRPHPATYDDDGDAAVEDCMDM